jgi:hypothetical protein
MMSKMAKTAVAKKTTTAVAAPRNTLPSTRVIPARGRGFEEADAESFAIPFLAMLQKGTPWADPDDPAYIKGAKAGMLINTVTLELFAEAEVIPCAYQRRFNRWAPRDAGGGFKGMFQPSQVTGLEASGTIAQDEDGRWYFALPDGSINEKKCDILTDTRLHYCLQVLDDGTLTQVLVSLARTQLKKSRGWMTLMSNRGGDMFDTVYSVSSKAEENDKGKWMGWVIQLSRESEPEEREAAERFYDSITAGKVKVKMDAQQDE